MIPINFANAFILLYLKRNVVKIIFVKHANRIVNKKKGRALNK